MKKLFIEIAVCSGDTLRTGEDLAGILAGVVSEVEQQDTGRAIFDSSGVEVGRWGYVND